MMRARSPGLVLTRPLTRPLPLAFLIGALLTGCTGPGGIYEGARQSNDALRTPTERATQPSRPYEDYDRNRPGKGS